jgi:hypothetical protein
MPGTRPQDESSSCQQKYTGKEKTMNTSPEVVKAEMDYRVERALGDVRHGTTFEHLRAARAGHPSWWRRMRVAHRPTDHAA